VKNYTAGRQALRNSPVGCFSEEPGCRADKGRVHEVRKRDYDFALLSRDPIGALSRPNWSLFVSLIRYFYFSSVLTQASLVRPSEK